MDGIAADPQYIDVWVPPKKTKTIPVETSRQAFAEFNAGTFLKHG